VTLVEKQSLRQAAGSRL